MNMGNELNNKLQVADTELAMPKLVVTAGPGWMKADNMVADMLDAGADAVRLNSSHIEPDMLGGWLSFLIKAGVHPSRIVVDLQGGKARVHLAQKEPLILGARDRVMLCSGEFHKEEGAKCHAHRDAYGADGLPVLYVDHPGVMCLLRPGQVVVVDDGRLRFRVVESAPSLCFILEAIEGGVLTDRRGLALPDSDCYGDAAAGHNCSVSSRAGRRETDQTGVLVGLSPRDLEIVRAALANGVSCFALSYVTNAYHLTEARKAMTALVRELDWMLHGSASDPAPVQTPTTKPAGVPVPAPAPAITFSPFQLHLIAKIEDRIGVENLEEIIEGSAADEIWLCRGDLGADAGDVELPALQRRVLQAALGRLPVLVAGQVFHHLTVAPSPTRSEVCHVADLVEQGVNGFVLSDETAVGPYGLQAVIAIRAVMDGAAARRVYTRGY